MCVCVGGGGGGGTICTIFSQCLLLDPLFLIKTYCFKNPSTYSVAARRYLHRYILSARIRMFVRFV